MDSPVLNTIFSEYTRTMKNTPLSDRTGMYTLPEYRASLSNIKPLEVCDLSFGFYGVGHL